MIPQRIDPSASPEDICAFSYRWRIDWMLAARLCYLAALLPYGISIRSGWRSCQEQQQLEQEGRPAAPCDVSTHTSCPVATGADLDIHVAVTNWSKAVLGEAAFRAGLRWGGGSPVSSGGIPTDWNHVDMGPR